MIISIGYTMIVRKHMTYSDGDNLACTLIAFSNGLAAIVFIIAAVTS